MLGIIVSHNKTFSILGYLDDSSLIEGKLYVDRSDERLYVYSLTDTLSLPTNGFFPIWDGSKKIVSKYSIEKYLKDIILYDLQDLSNTVNKDVSDMIQYNHRVAESGKILDPIATDEDNMFTQCIKGILASKKYTMVDLVDMSRENITMDMLEGYYNALTKIAFMRLDKWNIWINQILHLKYDLNVYDGPKKILEYKYPSNNFETGMVKYTSIVRSSEDPFKKIIKVLMVMKNIDKSVLKSDDVDDYTINNMMTTINSKKTLSAQLFSRFLKMAGLSYEMFLYDRSNELVFTYKEGF